MVEWFDKFKVGQEVKVVKKISFWEFFNGGGCLWMDSMNQTIGKIYMIIEVDRNVGYQLNTQVKNEYGFFNDEYVYDYYYPVESLAHIKGKQLLFNFME